MMLTAPLFVVVLLLTAVCIGGKLAEVGSVFLGVLLGLTLASTSIGAPILQALTAASSGLVDALSSLAGK